MLNLIISKLNSNRDLIKSFGSITLVQGLNIVLPIIYYPYLINLFGLKKYGVFLTFQAVTTIVMLVVEFGFNLSATRYISQNINSYSKVNSAVSTVLTIKVLFFITFTIPYAIALFMIGVSIDYMLLAILTYGLLLKETFISTWYFQAKEKLVRISVLEVITKLLLLLSVFLILNDKSDIDDYVFLLFISNFVIIICVLYEIFVIDKVKYNIPKLSDIKYFIGSSKNVFVNRFLRGSLLKLNALIISYAFGPSFLTLYNLSEMVVNTLIIPINMLNQVIYPRVSRTKNTSVIIKITAILFGFSLLIVFSSNYIISTIVHLFFDSSMHGVNEIFNIIIWLLPINLINYFIGNTYLLVYNYDSYYLKSTYIGNFFYILLVILCYFFESLNIIALSYIIVISTAITALIRIFKVIEIERK